MDNWQQLPGNTIVMKAMNLSTRHEEQSAPELRAMSLSPLRDLGAVRFSDHKRLHCYTRAYMARKASMPIGPAASLPRLRRFGAQQKMPPEPEQQEIIQQKQITTHRA